MADLVSLAAKVTAAVESQDGSWQLRRHLLNTIEDLRITAMGPAEYVTRMRYQALHNMSVMIVLLMGLLNPIVERRGEVVSVDTVAAETNSDKSMVVRMMRVMTALKICDEVGRERYKSNANAEYLNDPTRQGAWRFINGPTLKVMANVIPFMQANAGVYPQFPDASKGQTSAAEFTHGMPLWELFRSDPQILADFVAYLSGRCEDIVAYWFDIFPGKAKIAAKLDSKNMSGDRPLIVDVGGNVGYDLEEFQKRFPHFKGPLILQDLAENINKAKEVLNEKGIEAMVYDFFTPQPIKGALFYVFCGICHDWPDAEVKKLLSNTAAAMDEDSTLIIDEFSLPDEDAPLISVTYDVLMMINVSGIERTISHYRSLFDEIRLELVNIYNSPMDTVLEVRLKRK